MEKSLRALDQSIKFSGQKPPNLVNDFHRIDQPVCFSIDDAGLFSKYPQA